MAACRDVSAYINLLLSLRQKNVPNSNRCMTNVFYLYENKLNVLQYGYYIFEDVYTHRCSSIRIEFSTTARGDNKIMLLQQQQAMPPQTQQKPIITIHCVQHKTKIQGLNDGNSKFCNYRILDINALHLLDFSANRYDVNYVSDEWIRTSHRPITQERLNP